MGLKEEVLEMKKEVKEMQEHSFAMELLKDQKKQNKRMFIIILVILGMWFATIGYLIYVLNDIGVENLNLNDKQIEKLENHLNKQDKQYEEIIRLLKEGGILDGRREQN